MKRYVFNLTVIMFIIIGGMLHSQTPPADTIKQLTSAQMDNARKAVLADEKSYEAALKKVREVGKLSKSAVEDFIKKFSYNYQAQKGGVVQKTVKITPPQAGRYNLSIPAAYDQKKSWPLIISLHGAGGNGNDEYKWLWSAHAKKWNGFVASPSGEPAGAQWMPQEEFVLAVYKDVINTYNINTNCVYIHGFSNGGNGAWFYSIYYPWLFGAACPRSGGCPAPVALPNLLNVGMYITHGEKDGVIQCQHDRNCVETLKKLGYDCVYVEVPDGDHEPFLNETPKIIEYFNKHPRNPWPKKIVFLSKEDKPARAYWIEASKTSRYFSIEAQVQEGNKIVITCKEKPDEIIIHLSDALVDLDKPVVVSLNDNEVHNGLLTRSLENLVTDLRQYHDINTASCAQLKIEVK